MKFSQTITWDDGSLEDLKGVIALGAITPQSAPPLAHEKTGGRYDPTQSINNQNVGINEQRILDLIQQFQTRQANTSVQPGTQVQPINETGYLPSTEARDERLWHLEADSFLNELSGMSELDITAARARKIALDNQKALREKEKVEQARKDGNPLTQFSLWINSWQPTTVILIVLFIAISGVSKSLENPEFRKTLQTILGNSSAESQINQSSPRANSASPIPSPAPSNLASPSPSPSNIIPVPPSAPPAL